jgi:hypothetical protein
MNTKLNARAWHIWVSIALALPILIVAITSVFIAHDRSLGLKEIPVNVAWLPGYGATDMTKEHMEVRSALVTRDGRTLVGTKTGLYAISDGQAVPVTGLEGIEVRDLAETPQGLFAVTKKGVWQDRGNGWEQVYPGDTWSINVSPSGEMALGVKEQGLVVSRDNGQSWEKAENVTLALAAIPAGASREKMTLGKLVMDLHTGQALLGKTWEWAWIDTVGGAMTLLTVTGVVLWRRSQQQKTSLAQAQAVGPRPASGTSIG